MAAVETFRIPSRTRPGHVHNVSIHGDAVTCSCEAATFGRLCWAGKQVKEALEKQREKERRAAWKDAQTKMDRFARP